MSTADINWSDLLDLKSVRTEMSLSQGEFANLAGVSPRAIQSGEQGWRTPSPALERTVLLLLLAHRNGPAMGKMTCWQERDCSPETRETCIAYQSRQGHLCWLLTGTKCQGMRLRTWDAKKEACGRCEFMKRLVSGVEPSDGDR